MNPTNKTPTPRADEFDELIRRTYYAHTLRNPYYQAIEHAKKLETELAAKDAEIAKLRSINEADRALILSQSSTLVQLAAFNAEQCSESQEQEIISLEAERDSLKAQLGLDLTEINNLKAECERLRLDCEQVVRDYEFAPSLCLGGLLGESIKALKETLKGAK